MKLRGQKLDEERFDLVWIDKGREPQCEPNPDYPDGIDVDVTLGQRPACRSTLPYPARPVRRLRRHLQALQDQLRNHHSGPS